jgi:hypothetical protein
VVGDDSVDAVAARVGLDEEVRDIDLVAAHEPASHVAAFVQLRHDAKRPAPNVLRLQGAADELADTPALRVDDVVDGCVASAFDAGRVAERVAGERLQRRAVVTLKQATAVRVRVVDAVALAQAVLSVVQGFFGAVDRRGRVAAEPISVGVVLAGEQPSV